MRNEERIHGVDEEEVCSRGCKWALRVVCASQTALLCE